MIKSVKIELLKAVKCEKCGNVLLLEGDIVGRSTTFFDEEIIKNLHDLIHCEEQNELGDDIKDLTISNLHKIYDLIKNSSECIKEQLIVIQNIIGDLESSADVKAVITFKRDVSTENNDSKNINVTVPMIPLVLCTIPFITSVGKVLRNHADITSKILFGLSIALLILIIFVYFLLLSILENKRKSRTLLMLSTASFARCEKCGTLSESARRFIDLESVTVGTHAFKKTEIPTEDTMLSIDNLERLYKSVKKYDLPYMDTRYHALLAINDCIAEMKADKNVRVKMFYAGESGQGGKNRI